MDILNSTALVTGANRGLGRVFVEELVARGARRVYATARRRDSLAPLVDTHRAGAIVPLELDITDQQSVQAAVRSASDVNLLINNAGIATNSDLLTGDLAAVRAEMDTHFWGTLAVTRELAPVLAANRGGAIINVMSALSFRVYPGNGAYAVAKAAEWQLTNSTRLELAAQGTQVLGMHLSSTDTDMMAAWDTPKNNPRDVVRGALDALADGALEFLDHDSATLKRGLADTPEDVYGVFGVTRQRTS